MSLKRMLQGGLVLAALLLSLAGCGDASASPQPSRDSKPIVAVTIVPQQTFVEAVCGDLAEVVVLVPPGSSPENYEPTPMQMEKFSEASLYFTIGVPAEESGILSKIGDIKIVALHEAVAAVYPDLTMEEGGRDPHIWLSPKRVKVMVETIAREMSALDPDNQETYSQNAQAYLKELDELDREITSLLSGIQNRKFIVYHPAFGYLADDYNLTMYSLEEHGKEATARHLQEMIDLAKEEQIKVIFYQQEIDSSQAAAFAEELGGKTIRLEPLAADYIENLRKMAATMAEVMQ